MAVLTSIRIIRFYRIWLGFSNAGELSAVGFQLSETKAFNRRVLEEGPPSTPRRAKSKDLLSVLRGFSLRALRLRAFC